MLRGDVYRLKLPKGKGHEQQGARYGVVVQSDALAHHSTVLLAPTSLSVSPASFRPVVHVRGKATRVMVEQMGAYDPGRLGQQVGHLDLEEIWSIDEALGVVLGLR